MSSLCLRPYMLLFTIYSHFLEMLWAIQFADDGIEVIYYDEFINFRVDEKYHKDNKVALIILFDHGVDYDNTFENDI